MSVDPTEGPSTDGGRGTASASRAVVAGIVLLGAATVGYFALGMPGMDMDAESPTGDPTQEMDGMDMAGMDMNGHAVGADDFEARLADPDAVLVNVHVPDEGSIIGTDLSIPFDQLVGNASLPRDRGEPVLLYCRSGRMSEIAADALVEQGYTDIVQLEGGMDAWVTSGRTLVRE